MARRKSNVTYHKYECTITGESYKTTRKAPNPENLVSVNAYYELNPEKDDRPAVVKKKLGIETEQEES